MAYVRKRKQTLEQSMKVLRGDEPAVTERDYRLQLIRALNWYNTNWDEKDYRRHAEQYLKAADLKAYVPILNQASFLEIKMVGAVGRLVQTGQFVSPQDVSRIVTHLEKLKAVYGKRKPKQAVEKKTVSIQERIIESARQHIGEIEGAIDTFITEKSFEFSTKEYLQSNEVSSVVSKKIGDYFKPLLEELELAYSGKDDQLSEGYSNLPRLKLRRFVAFVKSIVDDCLQQVVTAKATRKPRARKVKPASVLVKKVKYMREFAELGLKSISAEQILTASELWVYNTVNRKLIVFYAADGGSLGVTGTSITNYDVAKSQMKTIRKPEEFFKQLKSTRKRSMANAWKEVKTKEAPIRSRINDSMILIAAN